MIRITRPSTVYFKFLGKPPDKFEISKHTGKRYFYRYLIGNEKGIKVNIPDNGIYTFNGNVETKIGSLQINPLINKIKLPYPERRRVKDYSITHDPNLEISPAIIFTNTGKIITGSKFKNMDEIQRIFILLHELGHFRYKTEKYCDLFALVEFCKMGYNPSTALYCLTDVLRQKPENDERISYVYNKLKDVDLIK